MKLLIPHFIHEQYIQHAFDGTFDAAILYVDISGFTQLTETLMQHHKGGAEILSQVLNHIFVPIIAKVYANGGFITTFAGDAFTAVYPCHQGEETQSLLRTTHFIRDFFAQHGDVHTGHGDLTLEVKIGLATGPVTWAILGAERKYTYHFRGAAIRAAIDAEGNATRGSVMADESIWPAIEPYVKGQASASPGAYELHAINPKAASDRANPARSLPQETLRDFVSDTVIDILVSESPAEFRQVAAVFIALDVPQENAGRWAEVGTAVINLTKEYQGYFNKLDFSDKGDVMVVLFGAPTAHENDLMRAADFLLALQELSRGWTTIRWKSGLTYGTVYAGLIGGEERCEYGALGDVMNLSCRMMERAQWGQIWVDEVVAKQLGDAYNLNALGAFTFKGKSTWILTYHLLNKKTLVETFYSGRLVGRDKELTHLSAAIQPILRGRFAGLIRVYGEAGIGKTRLIHGLAQQLGLPQRARWLTCPADALLRQSLNPFKYMLKTYFRQTGDAVSVEQAHFDGIFDALLQNLAEKHPQTSSLFNEMKRVRSILAAMVDLYQPDSLYAQLEPKLRFENTLAAIKTFVQVEALLNPVILHIEDAQWLDEDSITLLHKLSRGMAPFPVAILLSSRYLDDGGMHHFEIEEQVPKHILILEALPITDIEAIAAQCLKGPVAPDVAGLLADKTDGNPFFAEQLALNLQEQGALTQDKNRIWTLVQGRREALPVTLNAVLIARLDRLTAQVRQIVQTAAVLGREFEIQILSRMLKDDPALLNKLRQAEEEMIWSAMNEMRYMFRHALLRDAAYDMQMRARLHMLHQLAAEAISQVYKEDLSTHYADLAYHYDRAEHPEQAAVWYHMAGKQSAMQFANAEAVSHLTRALNLTPEGNIEQRYAILMSREQVYSLRGERAAQQQDLERLKSLAQTPQQRADLALREAMYTEFTGDYTQTIEAAQQVVELAHAQHLPKLEAAGHLQWGRAFWRQGQYHMAQPHFEQALILSEETSDPAMKADSLRNLGNVILCQGHYEPARNYYEQALVLYRRARHKQGEGSTLNNIGIVLLDQGDYAGALAYSEQALRIKELTGDRSGVGGAYRCLANSAYYLGDYDQAAQHLEQSWQRSQETADLPGQSEDLIGLAQLAHQAYDVETAYAYSLQALHIAEQVKDQHILGYALLYLGYALAGQGKSEEAEKVYRQAVDLRHQMQQPHLALEPLAGLAMLALDNHNPDRALTHVEEILKDLTPKALVGTREPFRIYLACYHVLKKCHDPRSDTVLQTAHALLQERAAKISDQAMQYSFLNKVPAHHEIMDLWQQHTQTDNSSG